MKQITLCLAVFNLIWMLMFAGIGILHVVQLKGLIAIG